MEPDYLANQRNCIVFSHFYSAPHTMSISEVLLTATIDTVSLHAEALQAAVSEILAHGPYVATRAGFESSTLWSKGIDSTNAPPRPTKCYHMSGNEAQQLCHTAKER